MEALDWPEIVAGILLATSAGTRLAGWLRARAKWVRIVIQTVEKLSGTVATATAVKHTLDRETLLAGGEVRAFAEAGAALAERAAGKTGKASEKRAVSKLARFADGVKRWAPIIGLFL